MTLRHLEIVQAVAQMGSFTRAAQSLYLTQSAVSHAVRELEDATGTALFDRLSKSVRLTSAGQRLLEQAAPILGAMRTLEAGLADLERQAPIQIVTSITIGAYWLPGILRAFGRIWPEAPVSVEVVSAANALEILRAGKADLALVEGGEPGAPLESTAFASYEICAACAPDFPGAGRAWQLKTLCEKPLLLRERGSAIRDAFDSALYLAGLTVRPTWQSVNSVALIEAAKAGLGVTVLPRLLLREALACGTLIACRVPQLRLENALRAVWHRDKSWNRPLRDLLSCMVEIEKEAGDKLPLPAALI